MGARSREPSHSARGYDECLVWGTIGWAIPCLDIQTLTTSEQLETAVNAAGKKLDMGRYCVHFESRDDLPLEPIGKLISVISSEKWIELYEQSRLMTHCAHHSWLQEVSRRTHARGGVLALCSETSGFWNRAEGRVTGFRRFGR